MKTRIPIIILLILIAVAAWFFFTRDTGTLGQEDVYNDFAITDTARISKIFIADQRENEVTLKRKENGKWVVKDGHKVREDGISNLLKTIRLIEVKAPVPKAAFETVVKNLATNSTKVEIYRRGEKKPFKTYYVGDSTQDLLGTYMLLEKDGEKSKKPFVTHIPGMNGYLSTRFISEAYKWKDRTIFSHDPEEISELTLHYFEEPENSFTIKHNEEVGLDLTWKGENVGKFDTNKVWSYLHRFEDIHYEEINATLPPKMRDSVLNSPPVHKFELIDTSGESTSLTTFHMPNTKGYKDKEGNLYEHDLDRMRALTDDDEIVFIQYAVFDKLLNERQDFLRSQPVEK